MRVFDAEQAETAREIDCTPQPPVNASIWDPPGRRHM